MEVTLAKFYRSYKIGVTFQILISFADFIEGAKLRFFFIFTISNFCTYNSCIRILVWVLTFFTSVTFPIIP